MCVVSDNHRYMIGLVDKASLNVPKLDSFSLNIERRNRLCSGTAE
jgi:hypothetical protein